ncbi:hypothetical protein DPMN_100574 [Dreissena polymorpha]|uniref:Uncharacterized protein n=1 Tax=Dreissena polymorpha TaxID=45954 RepID=A0A9D4R7J2_DREPO|nr:hypothetical protein DPMN_100574 [Dreissena polymorpha]
MNLISNPKKVMLHIILNSLKSTAEKLLVDEQSGFRAGWSSMEHTFNCKRH